jgi:hypothetical protein
MLLPAFALVTALTPAPAVLAGYDNHGRGAWWDADCDGDFDADDFVTRADNARYAAALMAFFPQAPGENEMDGRARSASSSQRRTIRGG